MEATQGKPKLSAGRGTQSNIGQHDHKQRENEDINAHSKYTQDNKKMDNRWKHRWN